MSILDQFPKLRKAIGKKKIVFIINVDVLEELEGLNDAIASLDHGDITVVLASKHAINYIQMLFPQHKNLIANNGEHVLFYNSIVQLDHTGPSYSYTDLKPQLDAFADEIGINKSNPDGSFLNLLIPATHHRYTDAVNLARKLIAGRDLTVTEQHTTSFQGFWIGPPNPDGMWKGIYEAIFALKMLNFDGDDVQLANLSLNNFANPLVAYIGERSIDNIVAMRLIKARGGPLHRR